MTKQEIASTSPAGEIERVLVQGDLSKLSPEDRVTYYARLCQSLNLNPLSRPFEYLVLSGKLTLYARRDCTDQLRRRDSISIHVVSRELIEGLYVVTARATTPDGRTDEEIGVVSVAGLKGVDLANALMKCSTKAKRRVTLSICGLGMLDETEIESIPAASLDAQARQSPPAQLPPAPLPPVLEPRWRRADRLRKEAGLSVDAVKSHIQGEHGKDRFTDLDEGQQAGVLAWLAQQKHPAAAT